MRIISERTLDIEQELCACFIDWQKEFDRVNWTNLMQILKANGIDWRETRSNSKLYMDQSVKLKLDQGAKISEDWKRRLTWMLFIAHSIQFVHRIPYERNS